MQIAYLGLGSNLGDREENIVTAVSQMRKSLRLMGFSSFYLTSPVGYRDQPDFLNMVVQIDLEGRDAFGLLALTKSIEKELGRTKTFHWGPRLIDIDILYIWGVHIETETLTVPHKEMLKRKFVLIPLSELTESIIVKGERLFLRCLIDNIPERENRVTLYKARREIELDK